MKLQPTFDHQVVPILKVSLADNERKLFEKISTCLETSYYLHTNYKMC